LLSIQAEKDRSAFDFNPCEIWYHSRRGVRRYLSERDVRFSARAALTTVKRHDKRRLEPVTSREESMHRFDRLNPIPFSLASLICAVLVLGLPITSGAADIYVNTTNDVYYGSCILTCSLRDAILGTNTNGQDDTIHVPAGTYTLSIPGSGEDNGLTGDLDLTSVDQVVIVGVGSGETIIDANNIDRVFHVNSGAGAVTFRGLTITGGQTNASGGGIFSWDSAVILTSCEISGNQITDPSTTFRGGGIFQESGSLVAADSTIAYNTSASYAGGFYGGIGSVIWFIRSTIDHNQSDIAGAAYIRGTSFFDNVTFFANTADNDVGGVWNEGTATFRQCTLSNPLNATDKQIFCRTAGCFTELQNTIINGVCDAAAGSNIDAVSGNFERGDTCYMGYSNWPNAGSAIGLQQFGWHGGGVQTIELGDWGVADDYWGNAINLLSEDARFTPRPVGLYGDAGAFERVPHEIFRHGFENRYTTGWSSTAQ